MRVSKSEAAYTIGMRMRVDARKHGTAINKSSIEELLSEARGGHLGEYLQACADATTWRSVMNDVRKNTERAERAALRTRPMGV